MARRTNADKPHLWKTNIAASFDQFNQLFMRFAPEAFHSTRVKKTGHVKAALLTTRDLRSIDAATPRTIRVRCQRSAYVRLCHWLWTA